MNLKFIVVASLIFEIAPCDGMFKSVVRLMQRTSTPIQATPLIGRQPIPMNNKMIPKPELTLFQWGNVACDGITSGLLGFEGLHLFNNHPALSVAVGLSLAGIRSRSRYAVERVLNEQQIQILKTTEYNKKLIAKSDREEETYRRYMSSLRHFQPFRCKKG